MQIPDRIRECICFVAGRKGEIWHMAGTAFFVSVPSAQFGIDYVYAITAKHVLQVEGEPWDEVALRVNKTDGGAGEFRTQVTDWTGHPNSDIAAINVALGDEFDYRVYPLDSAATTSFREEHFVTPGDDLLIIGLLANHYGKQRNIPVVRVGNIAAFPEEPIEIEDKPEEVILAEVRSIGGLSGSPVFLHLGNFRRDKDGDVVSINARWAPDSIAGNRLLGVVHGYFNAAGLATEDLTRSDGEPLNTGITVVIPVERIVELIDHKALSVPREISDRAFREKEEPEPASALPGQRTEFDRFEDLAQQASQRVPKKERDEKRKDES